MIIEPPQDNVRHECREQLVEYRILCRSEQNRNIQVLLDPSKENFYAPSCLVHIGDLIGRRVLEIGGNSNFVTVIVFKNDDAMTKLRLTLRGSQVTSHILHDIRVFSGFPLSNAVVRALYFL